MALAETVCIPMGRALLKVVSVSPSFALMQKKQKIKAEKPVPMGAPWAGLQRGATRHAAGMAQTAPLPLPYAATRPRPIGGTAFYAVILKTENPTCWSNIESVFARHSLKSCVIVMPSVVEASLVEEYDEVKGS
ncbi:MAG: hypothetical protein PWR03_1379 [Tenuifilum sp.]|jgi:hypothetical protein|uniref:hypothetical protein n=1 Tax=Tenuifilum sp. TaxID=2760880 RepID=UPI0024ABB529|nr:hypothetical protein [Tenuifilum sp.]MDI3527196.1 hypothetical protein [Tenuifilum sp.]